ncbi:MAG: anthranilate synthase component I, partial [Planctomycetales bacterium]|nr:anthranilate synthase component I [Planctomycetales bacterium]
MMHRPDFSTFSQLAADHILIPVYRRLLSDTLTPVSAFHKLDDESCACLFESVIGGEKVGRYSFLASGPFLQIKAWGQRVQVVSHGGIEEFTAENPLDELRARLAPFRAVHLPDLPPFAGGAIGYAGYDVVRYAEHLPHAPHDDRGLPDMSFAFYDRMVIFDNINKTMVVVALARIDTATADLPAAYEDAQRR